jgi:hypothetical protein
LSAFNDVSSSVRPRRAAAQHDAPFAILGATPLGATWAPPPAGLSRWKSTPVAPRPTVQFHVVAIHLPVPSAHTPDARAGCRVRRAEEEDQYVSSPAPRGQSRRWRSAPSTIHHSPLPRLPRPVCLAAFHFSSPKPVKKEQADVNPALTDHAFFRVHRFSCPLHTSACLQYVPRRYVILWFSTYSGSMFLVLSATSHPNLKFNHHIPHLFPGLPRPPTSAVRHRPKCPPG